MKKVIPFLFAFISLTAQGQYKKLFDFGGANGVNPTGDLILSGNTLYGMATFGGNLNYSGGYGVIFKINTDGTGFDTLMSFNGTNGAWPTGSFILSGNMLYGMTVGGGKYYKNPDSTGYGIIFKINTDGSGFDTVYNFNSTNGSHPYGSLILSDSILYGMTYDGGANNDGVVFKVKMDGTSYNTLINFNGSNGELPYGSLLLYKDTLYGMTANGGLLINNGGFGDGVMFKINIDESGFDTLAIFNNTNGQGPFGNFINSGDTLYGMTKLSYGDGEIFKINTNGNNFKILRTFNGTDGEYPSGSLILSNNVLYGMTSQGDNYNDGLVFQINTDGTGFDTLFTFNGTNGAKPTGSLIMSGTLLYGMTQMGGANNDGVIFEYDMQPTAIKTKTENLTINIFPIQHIIT